MPGLPGLLSVAAAVPVAVALCALPGSPAWAADFAEHDRSVSYPVAEIDDPVLLGVAEAIVRFPGGTGFFVTPTGLALTNLHVAKASGVHTWALVGWTDDDPGRRVAMDLVATSPALDIAVYQAALDGGDGAGSDEPAFVSLRPEPPEAGEPVAVVGHPGQLPRRVSFGRVLAGQVWVDGMPLTEYDARAWYGSSGSAVVDGDGRAVAVHVGWDHTGALHGALFGVRSDAILATVGPTLGQTLSEPLVTPCADAERYAVETRLLARGRGWDRVGVGLSADDEVCLEQVSRVDYALHPTFGARWMTGQADVTGHPIALQAWGCFDTRARVTLRSGEAVEVPGEVCW